MVCVEHDTHKDTFVFVCTDCIRDNGMELLRYSSADEVSGTSIHYVDFHLLH